MVVLLVTSDCMLPGLCCRVWPGCRDCVMSRSFRYSLSHGVAWLWAKMHLSEEFDGHANGTTTGNIPKTLLVHGEPHWSSLPLPFFSAVFGDACSSSFVGRSSSFLAHF